PPDQSGHSHAAPAESIVRRASRRRAASRGRAISYRRTWSTSVSTARSGSATHGWPRTRGARVAPSGERETGLGAAATEDDSARENRAGAELLAESCGAKNPIVFNGLALLTSSREGRAWQRLVASGCLLTSLWWSLPAAAVETGLGALVAANRRA